MIFYTDIKCSWHKAATFHISLDAPSASVAVAMAEAWCAGFRVGTDQHVTLDVMNVSSKRPRGVQYIDIQSWDQVRLGLHG